MKRTLGEKIFGVFNVIIMLLMCVVTLYPYFNQLAISFNEGADSARGGITIWPRAFTLDNYITVFTNAQFGTAVLVSVTRVILSTLLALLVIYCCAYGITRRKLPHRKGITLFFLIPAYVQAGTIPIYMLFRYLGLINNYLVYIIPLAFTFYYMVIIRSFLQDLPPSIEESAQLDGANDIQIMFKIIFPLSLPVVATVALWVAIQAWNDWTTTLLYVTETKLQTLQYLMMRLIKESDALNQVAEQAATKDSKVSKPTSDSVKAATLIVSTVPIICVYPWLQKYFIKGVTLGAVKE